MGRLYLSKCSDEFTCKHNLRVFVKDRTRSGDALSHQVVYHFYIGSSSKLCRPGTYIFFIKGGESLWRKCCGKIVMCM